MPRQFTVNADTLQSLEVNPEDLQPEAAPPSSRMSMRPTPAPPRTPVAARGTNLDLSKSEAAAPYLLTAATMAPMAQGLRAGIGMAGGAKALASGAAPAVKYEAAKSTLEALGVPTSVAVPIALTVSGYGGKAVRARASRAKPASAAPPASPAASTPATPAPVSGPSVPKSGPTPSAAPTPSARPHPEGGVWSPQRIQNELGIQARRQQVTLTDQQYAQAAQHVAQGKTPAEAVKAVASGITPKLKLTSSETQVYSRLLKSGKTHDEAIQAIETQRQLAGKLGTPSTEQVRRDVARRNQSGRWETGPRYDD